MTRGQFVAGTDSSASALNDCFDPPRGNVYNAGVAQSIATGVAAETAVTFDSERDDAFGFHSTSVNTSRLTVPAGCPGRYDLGANVRWQTNATGTRRLSLWVNGVNTGLRIAHVIVPAVAGAPIVMQICRIYPLVVGDYVELAVAQDSGGNLTLDMTSAWAPELWWHWKSVS